MKNGCGIVVSCKNHSTPQCADDSESLMPELAVDKGTSRAECSMLTPEGSSSVDEVL